MIKNEFSIANGHQLNEPSRVPYLFLRILHSPNQFPRICEMQDIF